MANRHDDAVRVAHACHVTGNQTSGGVHHQTQPTKVARYVLHMSGGREGEGGGGGALSVASPYGSSLAIDCASRIPMEQCLDGTCRVSTDKVYRYIILSRAHTRLVPTQKKRI